MIHNRDNKDNADNTDKGQYNTAMQIIERIAIGANHNLQKFKWPLLTFDPCKGAPKCNNQIVSNVLL